MEENINKYNKPKSGAGLTVALIIAAVVIVALVGVLIVGTVYNVNRGLSFWGGTSNYTYSGAASYTSSGEFSVSAADISDINVDWIAGNITVTICDGEEIKVSEINDSNDPNDMMRYKVDRGTLIIKFRNSGRFISTNFRKDLIVEIPKDIAASLGLDIEAVSADIDINTSGEAVEMNFGSINIDTVSGHACICDVNASSVDVNTVSGDTILSGKIANMDIDTVSGNVSVDVRTNPKELDVVTVSGDVNIKVPDDPNKTVIDTVSGEVNVNGVKTKRSYEAENPSCSGNIDIDTVSGDVTITSK